jgi:hypothetical protein
MSAQLKFNLRVVIKKKENQSNVILVQDIKLELC